MEEPTTMTSFMASPLPRQRSRYHLSLVEDAERLRNLWQIDCQMYPDANIGLEQFSQWWERYNPGIKLVTDADNQITAAMGLWALSEGQTRAFIAGSIAEADLVPLHLEELQQSPSRFWYCSGLFTTSRNRLDSPLRKLLRAGLASWFNSSHLAYPVYCFALGFSSGGRAILDRFGFELVKPAEEMLDGQPLYSRLFVAPAELRDLLK